ncbi:MAG TPA: hypothetical protein VGQ34_01015 [Sphingomicrobium sp.]|nr:hypothetical protein [Sphingomicrobium sp.]
MVLLALILQFRETIEEICESQQLLRLRAPKHAGLISNQGGYAAPGKPIVFLIGSLWKTVLEWDAGHAKPVS